MSTLTPKKILGFFFLGIISLNPIHRVSASYPPTKEELQLLEKKAKDYQANIKKSHLINGQIVTRKSNGDPDDLGDSSIWTALYMGAEAFRYKTTGDVSAYKNVEECVTTLHRMQLASGTPGIYARYVYPDGSPYIPEHNLFMSKDQINGIMFGYYQAFSILNDGKIKDMLLADVNNIGKNFLDHNLTFQGKYKEYLDFKPQFDVNNVEALLGEKGYENLVKIYSSLKKTGDSAVKIENEKNVKVHFEISYLFFVYYGAYSIKESADHWDDPGYNAWRCCGGVKKCFDGSTSCSIGCSELDVKACRDFRDNLSKDELYKASNLFFDVGDTVGATVWRDGALDTPEKQRMREFFDEVLSASPDQYTAIFQKHWDKGFKDHLNLLIKLIKDTPEAITPLLKVLKVNLEDSNPPTTLDRWLEKNSDDDTVNIVNLWYKNDLKNRQIINQYMDLIPDQLHSPSDLKIDIGGQGLLHLHILKTLFFITKNPLFSQKYQESFDAFSPTIKSWNNAMDHVVKDIFGQDADHVLQSNGTHLLEWYAEYDLLQLENNPLKRKFYQDIMDDSFGFIRRDLDTFQNFIHEVNIDPQRKDELAVSEGIGSLILFPSYGPKNFNYQNSLDVVNDEFGGVISFNKQNAARNPIPLDKRPRNEMIWQGGARALTRGDLNWTYPGVDFTLPYWMGRWHGFYDNAVPAASNIFLVNSSTWIQNNSPVFQWDIPNDPNNDQLHFIVEISTSQDFSSLFSVYYSTESIGISDSADGFSPVPPVAPLSGNMTFTVPSFNSDSSMNLTDQKYFYWARVKAFDGKSVGIPSSPIPFGIDQSSPVVTIKNSSLGFSSALSQTVRFDVTITENESGIEDKVSAVVLNGSGEKIRTLYSNALSDKISYGTTINLSWDGKTENGAYAAEGNYSLAVDVKDRAGNSVYVVSDLVYVDTTAPTLLNLSYSPFPSGVDHTIQLNFSVWDNFVGTITSNVVMEGPEVVNLVQKKINASLQESASFYFSWDMKNQLGIPVKEGEYTAYLKLSDAVGNATPLEKVANFIVDRSSPAIVQISAQALATDGTAKGSIFSPERNDVIDLSWTLSEDVTAEIFIKNSLGQIIDQKVEPVLKGQVSHWKWNGTFDGTRIVPDGQYFFQVIAKDQSGNQSVNGNAPFIKNSIPAQITFPGKSSKPTLVNNSLIIQGQAMDPNPQNQSDFSSYELWVREGDRIDFSLADNNPNQLNSSLWKRILVPAINQSPIDPLYPNSNISRRSVSNSTLGILNTSNFLTEKTYTVLLISKDGEAISFDSVEIKKNSAVDNSVPVVTINTSNSNSSFEFDSSNSHLDIDGTLSGNTNNAVLSLDIFKAGISISTLVHHEEVNSNGGSFHFSWDGKNSSLRYVDDGSYLVRVSAYDMDGMGAGSDEKNIQITIPVDKPLEIKKFIFTNSGGSIVPVGGDYSVDLTISKPALVTVKLYDQQGVLINTLLEDYRLEENQLKTINSQINNPGLNLIQVNAVALDENKTKASASLQLIGSSAQLGSGNLFIETPVNALDGIQGQPYFNFKASAMGTYYPNQEVKIRFKSTGYEIRKTISPQLFFENDWSHGNYSSFNGVVLSDHIELEGFKINGNIQYGPGQFISKHVFQDNDNGTGKIVGWGRFEVEDVLPLGTSIIYFIETWDGSGAWVTTRVTPGEIITAPVNQRAWRWKAWLNSDPELFKFTPRINRVTVNYVSSREDEIPFETDEKEITGICWNGYDSKLPVDEKGNPVDLLTLFPELANKVIKPFPSYIITAVSNPSVHVQAPRLFGVRQFTISSNVSLPWNMTDDLSLYDGYIHGTFNQFNRPEDRFDFKYATSVILTSAYPSNFNSNLPLELKNKFTFWRNDSGEIVNNPHVSIDRNSWKVSLSYPDGSINNTLRVKSVTKGTQVFDDFATIALNPTETPRSFIPIKGYTTSESTFQSMVLLYRKVGTDVWKFITSSTVATPTYGNLAAWDVTGLNGDFDIKLVVMDQTGPLEKIVRMRVGSLVRRQDVTSHPLIYAIGPYSKGFLEFSPRALERDAIVTMTPVSAKDVTQESTLPLPIGSIYRFQPDDIQFVKDEAGNFKEPGTLTVRYTADELKGIDLGKLTVYRLRDDGTVHPFTTPSGRFFIDNGTPGVMDPDDVYEISNMVTGFSSYMVSDKLGLAAPYFVSAPETVYKSDVQLKGKSEPSSTVQIFINKSLQTTVNVDGNGEFLAELKLSQGENQLEAGALKPFENGQWTLKSVTSLPIKITYDQNPVSVLKFAVDQKIFNPNKPFSNYCNGSFQLSKPCDTVIGIYKDGVLIKNILNQVQATDGTFRWDGTDESNTKQDLGLYEVRLEGKLEGQVVLAEKKKIEIIEDNFAPTSKIIPSDDVHFVGNSTKASIGSYFSIVSTDASGISLIKFSLDSGDEKDYDGTPIEFNSLGFHKIVYRAMDLFGNWETSKEFSFEIDQASPSIKQFLLSSDYVGNNSGFIRIIWNEPVKSTPIVTINGISLPYSTLNDQYNFSPNLTSFPEGPTKAQIKAEDLFGNVSFIERPGFIVDRTPPKGPLEISTFLDEQGSIQIDFTENGELDPIKTLIQVRKKGNSAKNLFSQVVDRHILKITNPAPVGGTYFLDVTPYDKAGNRGPVTHVTAYQRLKPITDLRAVSSAQVQLCWTTPTLVDYSFDHYQIKYSTKEIRTQEDFDKSVSCSLPSKFIPNMSNKKECVDIDGVPPLQKIYFAVNYVDEIGNESAISTSAVSVVETGMFSSPMKIQISSSSQIQQSISRWGDFNNDGILEQEPSSNLFLVGVSSHSQPNLPTFRNSNGRLAVQLGSFTFIPVSLFLKADWDNDGDFDFLVSGYKQNLLLIGSTPTITTLLFENTGNGQYTYHEFNFSDQVIAALDTDQDGDLDVLTSSGVRKNNFSQFGLKNTPPSPPTNINGKLIGNSLTLTWDSAIDQKSNSKDLSYVVRVGSHSDEGILVSSQIGNPGASYSSITKLTGSQLGLKLNGVKKGPIFISVKAINPGLLESEWSLPQDYSPNTKPVFMAIQDQVIQAGYPFEMKVEVKDDVPDSISMAAFNLPDGAIFDVNQSCPTIGTLRWTPDSSQSGVYDKISFAVSDGAHFVPSDLFRIIVYPQGKLPLNLRDIVWANRSSAFEEGTEYFHVNDGKTPWSNNQNSVYLIGADNKTQFNYNNYESSGALIVSHTFNSSVNKNYSVSVIYKSNQNTYAKKDLYFPAFKTVDGKKMYFYVAEDGSSYFADQEHDGISNEQNEFLFPAQALQPTHLARAAVANGNPVNSIKGINIVSVSSETMNLEWMSPFPPKTVAAFFSVKVSTTLTDIFLAPTKGKIMKGPLYSPLNNSLTATVGNLEPQKKYFIGVFASTDLFHWSTETVVISSSTLMAGQPKVPLLSPSFIPIEGGLTTGGISQNTISIPEQPQKANSAESSFGSVYVYPNPSHGSVNPTFHIEAGVIDQINIKIFDIAGELVDEIVNRDSAINVEDNGKSVLANEVTWNKDIKSGLYLYVITVQRQGQSPLQIKGKFTVAK